jgi:hypothetical protein
MPTGQSRTPPVLCEHTHPDFAEAFAKNPGLWSGTRCGVCGHVAGDALPLPPAKGCCGRLGCAHRESEHYGHPDARLCLFDDCSCHAFVPAAVKP